MARKKRVWYPGAKYHVMSRGNRRAAIFQETNDYISFLSLLRLIREKYPFRIHSLCLMTNHFHMAVETEETPLWKIMQKILSIYAEDFNHKYSYTGHLFEGRYTSCIIENDIYFLEVSRYIHLNPVKAQMVREPLAYEYSSYGTFVDYPDEHQETGQKMNVIKSLIKEIVDTEKVLGCFRAKLSHPREQYRMFVEGKMSHEEHELLIQKDMNEDDMWLPW